MTTWLTESQALEYLGLEVTEKHKALLKTLGYKKKVRWTKIIGSVQYDKESLDRHREAKARGKKP